MTNHVGDTWHAMCEHAWHFESYKYGSSNSVHGGSNKEKEEEGKREREERKRERRKRRKRGKRKRKRKECRMVSRPRRQRTRNYATRGRFPPTFVILRLEAT